MRHIKWFFFCACVFALSCCAVEAEDQKPTFTDLASEALQITVSKNVGKKEAIVINSAITNYLRAKDATAKTAAYTALQTAVGQYIHDADAQKELYNQINNAMTHQPVDVNKAGNALLRSGLYDVIEDSHLSTAEKKVAREAVNALGGRTNDLQGASVEALQKMLVKEGLSAEKANALTSNAVAFVADTKNTTALKSAASIALQEAVSKNVGKKEAAVINSAISEYLNNPDSTAKTAAFTALTEVVDKFISDKDAKDALYEQLQNARERNAVDVGKVGNALLRSGLNDVIDNSHLSADEKRIAREVVKELSTGDGNLQVASVEALTNMLVKEKKLDPAKANELATNAVAFVADTKNTTALKSATSIALQEAVSKNVGKKEAAVINSAISEYLNNPDSTAKTTALTALTEAVNMFISDKDAKDALYEQLKNARENNVVDVGKVGNALLRSGLNDVIDNSHLSSGEKMLAKEVVKELSGVDGDLQGASAEALKNMLVKKGMDPEKANTIAVNAIAFAADTTNTTAFKASASLALQDAVSHNVGKKEAEVINAAISEYLDNPDGTARTAAWEALKTAINQNITDEDTKNTLLEQLQKAKNNESIDVGKVSNALLKGGINTFLDHTHLSEAEKNIAKAAVDEILGKGGNLSGAGSEWLKEILVKNHFSPEQAKIIADNTAAFASDPKNTDALKLAGATIIQGLVSQYVDEKGAAVINSTISAYLENGSLEGSAYAAIETAIDQWIKDEASREALKKAVGNLKNHEEIDVKELGTTLCKAGLEQLIAKLGLSEEEARWARAALAELVEEKGALLDATAETLKAKLIEKGFSPDRAESIAKNMRDFLADTGNTAALKQALSEALQEMVSRYVGKDGAVIINAAIEAYLKEGGSLSGAAKAALDQAIDKYITDETAKKQLKNAIADIVAGKQVDISEVGTALFRGSMYSLIDNSNLSEEQKKLLKALVSEMSGEEGALTNAGLEALEGWMIKKGISEEEAHALVTAVKDYFSGTAEDTKAIVTAAKTILTTELAKAIDKQLNKLIAKYPFLKDIFEMWGINGKSVANFIMNLSMKDIKAFFEKICKMSWDDWKELGQMVISELLEKGLDALCKYAEKNIDKYLQKIFNKIMVRLSRIKALEDYMAIIQVAGAVMTESISIEAKGYLNEGKTKVKNMWGGGQNAKEGGQNADD